jgi:DNA repair photolyase
MITEIIERITEGVTQELLVINEECSRILKEFNAEDPPYYAEIRCSNEDGEYTGYIALHPKIYKEALQLQMEFLKSKALMLESELREFLNTYEAK